MSLTSSGPAPSPVSTGRVFYLDAVRAFAMFFGIFAHGSTIAHPYIDQMNFFFYLQMYNDLFRAATFFLVSGFFSALLFKKNDIRKFARSRFDVIIIPLVCSMIFIVPITNWMIFSWHNGYMSPMEYFSGGWRQPTVGNDTWALHIWFLYSLAIYAVLTPLLAPIINARWFSHMLDTYIARTSGWTHWANVLVFAAAVMFGRAAYDLAFRYLVDDTMWHWIVRASLMHLPIFFLGMVAFTHRQFLETINQLSIPGLLLFVLAYWGIHVYADDLPRNLERVLYWLVRGGLSLFVISSILWFFKTFANKPSRFLTYAVDSAYSFYLFHFTFIYLVAWASRLVTDNLYVSWVLIILFATPLTLGWHSFVIDRVPLLRYLFTGKKERRAKALQSPSPAE